MNRRPVSITVISILGIIWAGLTLLCVPGSWIMNATNLLPKNPILKELEKDTLYSVINYGNGCLGLVLAVVLLAGSIGSLSLKPWARVTMLGWAVVAIALNVVGTILAFAYVVPMVGRALDAAGNPAAAQAGKIGGYIGGCGGAIFGMILPVLVLVFFTREKVVNAFKGIFEASAGDFPVDYTQAPPNG